MYPELEELHHLPGRPMDSLPVRFREMFWVPLVGLLLAFEGADRDEGLRSTIAAAASLDFLVLNP